MTTETRSAAPLSPADLTPPADLRPYTSGAEIDEGALLLELEPVVAQLYDRHASMAQEQQHTAAGDDDTDLGIQLAVWRCK